MSMDTQNNNAPNTNLAHIITIEGLASQINTHLEALTCKNPGQQITKDDAREVLANWQQLYLGDLRKAFE